jgi:hypothetical protein
MIRQLDIYSWTHGWQAKHGWPGCVTGKVKSITEISNIEEPGAGK